MASLSNEGIENILQNLVDDDFHGESCSEDGEISEVGDNLSIHTGEEDEIGVDDISDDGNDPVNSTKALLKGKNGHIWSTVARTSSKTPRRNKICVSIQRLARGAAQNIVTEKDAFTTLLTEEIIDLIVLYTNQEIDRRAPKYENQRYVHKTDSTEFKALIGLLLFSAINKDNRKSANDMWSAFSAAVYKSIMSAADYVKKLVQTIKSSCRNVTYDNCAEDLGIKDDFRFYQDNDPKHTSGIVQTWLIYNCPHVMKPPAQSPDLNVIENLWSILDTNIRKRQISNKNDLKVALMEEWAKIPPETTKKLVESMPKRLKMVIDEKGGHTKY
ncbi:uncharacterized protein LOC120781305 [Bactrocera tryoni]|uniref:uncharacterized protein LOC120781305 n=1 Tax=Bactrocera tryoni TaxID=59916 RepID=UPI001A96648B|nr:uncharacterized protein LOC120781305 [Bactrocera tryoni]